MTSCRAPALLPVEQLTYDGGGAGDGNLTQKVDLTGAGTGRVTQTAFDWRDRENAT